MKNLAPNITRQRLVIEGFFEIDVDKRTVTRFFNGITKDLNLKTYGNC